MKSLEAPYAAAAAGPGWLKVKPRHKLARDPRAEWGHGRRRGWLSNLHLGARSPTAPGHVMLGKDSRACRPMLEWQPGTC